MVRDILLTGLLSLTFSTTVFADEQCELCNRAVEMGARTKKNIDDKLNSIFQIPVEEANLLGQLGLGFGEYFAAHYAFKGLVFMGGLVERTTTPPYSEESVAELRRLNERLAQTELHKANDIAALRDTSGVRAAYDAKISDIHQKIAAVHEQELGKLAFSGKVVRIGGKIVRDGLRVIGEAMEIYAAFDIGTRVYVWNVVSKDPGFSPLAVVIKKTAEEKLSDQEIKEAISYIDSSKSTFDKEIIKE